MYGAGVCASMAKKKAKSKLKCKKGHYILNTWI